MHCYSERRQPEVTTVSDRPVFSQNIIAVIWDFDRTLSPHYMQRPLFEAFGVDEAAFWREVQALPKLYRAQGVGVNPDTCYLGHLLTYVAAGRMAGLNNARLRELGAQIPFYPGIPEIFGQLKFVLDAPEFTTWDLQLEHYVVSTGLKEMIAGSAIASHLSGIWACEFIEHPAPPGFDANTPLPRGPISQIAGFLDNTTKTRAIFEINKGVNKHPEISVNDVIAEEDRRVPVRNMIYVADGPSDVPSFSVIRSHNGLAFAVYDPDAPRALEQVEKLRQSGRVDHFGAADYSATSGTARWLSLKIQQIAQRIAQEKERSLESRRAQGPRHMED